MKSKFSIFWLFLFAVNSALSQKEFISFKILDSKTKKPLQFCYVVVLGKSSSTQSNDSGHVEIKAGKTDTLVIFQAGYHLNKCSVGTITENNYIVFLNQKTLNLEEVEVRAKTTDTLQNNNNTTFLSFDFYDDYILALVNKGKKYNSLFILDINGNKLCEKYLSIKTETIFKDCFENLHLITRDSIYQVYYNYKEISLLKPFPVLNFYTHLKPCECCHGTKYIFKTAQYRKLKNTFLMFDETKPKKQQVLAVVADSSAIKGFNMDFDINYFLSERRKGLGYSTSVSEINKNIDKYREDLILPVEYTRLLQPIISEMKKLDTTFALFDYTNKTVSHFLLDATAAGQFELYGFKDIQPKLIRDPDLNNYLFSSTNPDGNLTLYRYDPAKNKLSYSYQLTNFHFVGDFKIKANYIYFIYKDRSSALTRSKIIKHYIEWKNK